MKSVLFVLAVCGFSCMVNAGEQTGTVIFNHGQYASNSSSAGYTFVYLVGGQKMNNPACSTVPGTRWVIDNSWPAAKIQISTLLTAAVSGKRVTIYGSGNCEVWGDSETATNIFLAN